MFRKFSKNSLIISLALAAVLLVTAVYSATYAAPKYSDPAERMETIEYLDSKRNTVLALTTASTTASTALTMLKDDMATPIATELAQMGGYFMIILAAITLEKYLVTLSGLIVFKYVIPLACLLLIIYIFLKDVEWTKVLAVKLISLGLSLFLLVPASVEVCKVIENTYDTSIEAALESAENATILAEDKDKRDKFSLKNIWSNVTETVSTAIESVKNILNNFIEAVSILLITSCVIPILMLIIFVWLINTIAGLNITLPRFGKGKHNGRHFLNDSQSTIDQ